uniref:Uncharacterized protein n=1 Tax=Rhizophora mucronata TaxID=61149 RepID=A0A2P2N6L5_RHIMU
MTFSWGDNFVEFISQNFEVMCDLRYALLWFRSCIVTFVIRVFHCMLKLF